MKKNKLIIFFSCASIIIILIFTIIKLNRPLQTETQISPEIVQVFLNANININNVKITPNDFTLPLLGGDDITLSDFKGKVVILNFWATWCPPCREEMPSMEVLYRLFKNEGLEMLAVNLGEADRIVQQFIQDNGYTFPIPMDRGNRVGTIYGVSAIPTSFIIDREGMIIARIVGSIYWDTPQIFKAFEALLKS
ncbi:MAG: TlpA family protein disulfide reductase [Treponema sp.]|nr:TlpA family protein disulfide reductase [Treponema sp.]